MGLLKVSDAISRIEPSQCKHGKRRLVVRGPRQRKNSWTDKQRMAMLDSILSGFQCTVYIIQDMPGMRKCDEVFDGAHKLETVIDFVHNKIRIKKVKTAMINWERSKLGGMIGKRYDDLTDQEQLIFDNYEFIVNIIPPEIANDPDQLTSLWIRLNNSGNEVNEYEIYIQIYHTFCQFLSAQAAPWFGTVIYKKRESLRGELEIELMKLLALSEPNIYSKFLSQLDIYRQWLKIKFGSETSKVDEVFLTKEAELTKRLKHLHTVYEFLKQKNVFKQPTNELTRRMVIGRIAYWCDTTAKLTRCSEPISEYATMILTTPVDVLMKRLGRTQPNARYHCLVLDMIDRDIKDIVTQRDDPRFFTPTMREKKLEEQGGNCWWCTDPILPGQKREAHHIIPYRDEGKTTFDNLAILHTECHKECHANPNKKRRME